MKNLSLALNVVLIAAVAFLYVKVYSGPNKQQTAVQVAKTNSTSTVANAAIAFVELDSLNDKMNTFDS